MKRPTGTFAYVRLVLTPKNSTGTSAHQSVWHLLNLRAANEAERNAWNVPAMQATITTQGTTISGNTGSIATLTTNLSATNTTAVNAASAAAAAVTLAGSKGIDLPAGHHCREQFWGLGLECRPDGGERHPAWRRSYFREDGFLSDVCALLGDQGNVTSDQRYR